MNLHDQLEHDLTSHDSGLDIDRLSKVARTQGTRALRRRRGAVAVAGIAAVAVVGVSVLSHGTGAQHLPVTGQDGSQTSAAQADFDPAHPGPSGPATGRGLAAGLRWAVADVQAGTATNYGGQEGHEWYAQLEWTADDGQGISVVGINVQDDMGLHRSCGGPDITCHVTTLPDGTLLKTWEQDLDVTVGTGITRGAQLLRPDGVRVGVTSTNGFDRSGGQWTVTRPQPPLTTAQLTTIAEQPFWGATLPTTFLDEGRDLAPYEVVGSGF